ncbi:MAG: hypothetical protein ACK4SJ_08185 [Sphingorhabdus sp.]
MPPQQSSCSYSPIGIKPDKSVYNRVRKRSGSFPVAGRVEGGNTLLGLGPFDLVIIAGRQAGHWNASCSHHVRRHTATGAQPAIAIADQPFLKLDALLRAVGTHYGGNRQLPVAKIDHEFGAQSHIHDPLDQCARHRQVALPGGGAQVAFALTAITPSSVTSENGAYDFPQRFAYRRAAR